MLKRIWQLAFKEFIHFSRDRLMTPFILLGPLLQLVLMAWATSRDVEHLSLVVFDQDRSQISRALVTAVTNAGTLDVTARPDSLGETQRLIEGGKATVALLIPPGFAAELEAANSVPQLQVIIDGSNMIASRTVRQAIEGAVAEWGQKLAFQWGGARDAGMPIDLRMTARFNEELEYGLYAIPAELGFVVYMVTLLVAAIGIARERELGTLEQLLVTPVTSLELIIGKAIPAMVIAYVDFLLLLPLTVWGFNVPSRGSVWLLLSLTLLFITVELGWGIMISAIARDQQQALLFVFLLAMTEMVFSGYMVPVDNMPSLLRAASNLFPIKHYLIIVRHIMVKGVALPHIWIEAAALIVLGIGSLTATFLILGRRRVD
jgi:ABC-2 type transport system permease protein